MNIRLHVSERSDRTHLGSMVPRVLEPYFAIQNLRAAAAAAAFLCLLTHVCSFSSAVGADLKEDGLPIHPPEVGNRVSAVTSTGQQLQRSVAAGTQLLWKADGRMRGMGAQLGRRLAPHSLTLLFLPGLITDGRAQLQPGAVRQAAAAGADHHAQAGLLQDLAVVVVGVSHRPPRQMPLSVLVLS